MAETLLSVKNVRAGYGDAVVLNDISFDLADKGSLAVLGRNGVGKSTLLLTIMGFTRMTRGSIHWRGEDITRVAPYRRARAGIGWVAQEREIFPSLTVAENLTVTARPGHWTIERIYELLPRLKERRANKGNQLSGGEQQMLAVGRALMLNPRVLLLDEPTEGLAPIIVEQLLASIRRIIRDEGMATIIVEQHARKILKVTDRAVILDRGEIVHHAASAALLADPTPLESHLGVIAKGAAA